MLERRLVIMVEACDGVVQWRLVGRRVAGVGGGRSGSGAGEEGAA